MFSAPLDPALNPCMLSCATQISQYCRGEMWQHVCLRSLLSCLIVVFIAKHLGAQDGFLREGDTIREARQVACTHPAKGLVYLTLQELGNTTRTVVANKETKSCSGNITFHSCPIDETVVNILVVITDLEEGEVRRVTCQATIAGSSEFVIRPLGEVNLTNTGRNEHVWRSESTSDGAPRGMANSPSSAETVRCNDGSSAKLVALIVVLVLFAVGAIVMLAVYLRARRAGVSVTASNWVTDVKVRSSNEYQSSRHTAAPGQAPDVPGRGHVMQYHQPVDLSPEDFLPHPTDAGGVDSGPQLYQQPWGQLDGEIAGRLASFRPTPRMCHVPGFEKPGVVTDRPPADNE